MSEKVMSSRHGCAYSVPFLYDYLLNYTRRNFTRVSSGLLVAYINFHQSTNKELKLTRNQPVKYGHFFVFLNRIPARRSPFIHSTASVSKAHACGLCDVSATGLRPSRTENSEKYFCCALVPVTSHEEE
jgi:hypothetical protein